MIWALLGCRFPHAAPLAADTEAGPGSPGMIALGCLEGEDSVQLFLGLERDACGAVQPETLVIFLDTTELPLTSGEYAWKGARAGFDPGLGPNGFVLFGERGVAQIEAHEDGPTGEYHIDAIDDYGGPYSLDGRFSTPLPACGTALPGCYWP